MGDIRFGMNKAQIELVVRISEEGSFSKAGGKLNMTQPAVSRAVAAIETELNTVLILRNRKNKLVFTELGELILISFRNILSEFTKIEEFVAAERGLETGQIRIGAYPTACTYFLPKIIRRMEEEHPNLQISLSEGSVDEVKNWLHNRVVDVGIIIPPNENFHCIPLARDKMIAAVSSDHPLSHREQIRVEDIRRQELLLVKGGYETQISTLLKDAGIEPDTRVKYRVSHLDTALRMVQEGLGITFMTERSIISLPENVIIRNLEPEVYREINIAVLSLDESTSAVKYFIKTAKELYAGI